MNDYFLKSWFWGCLFVPVLALLLSSCADTSDPLGIKGKSAAEIYTEANSSLMNKSYDKSIKLYNALEATYPYGVYAQQGLLDLAYAQYQYDKYQDGLSTVDQFINTYTTSPNMDYALYLKGYINYRHNDGFFAKITSQDASELDVSGLREAYKAFELLIKNYPDSKYTSDAKVKINEIVMSLAKSEIIKARYYMSVKAYEGAINRANVVITTYSSTSYTEEALAIIVVAYKNLGNNQLSMDTKKVLGLNYPESVYLKKDWRYHDYPWYKIY